MAMLLAVWPSFKDFPNHIPASSYGTSAHLLRFFPFVIIQLPLLWLQVSKWRFLSMEKMVVMPIFGCTSPSGDFFSGQRWLLCLSLA